MADKDAKIKQYETDSVKTRCLLNAGLPIELFNRVNGTTEEEIQKDVDSLKTLVGSRLVPPLKQPGTPEEDGVTAAFKRLNPNISM